MSQNLLIVHGGGPTAVINASLAGVIQQAQNSTEIKRIFAARYGTGGILKNELIDLSHCDEETLEVLTHTPGSAIGTSRDALEAEDYEKIVDRLVENKIGYVVFNGGNGTMDTCGKVYQVIQKRKLSIQVIGIPKTMDNDLSCTDHSPGFLSAVNDVRTCVRNLCYDVQSMPIHVVIIEISGRNAGWLTASSALADLEGVFNPDLIYLPELPFSKETFLSDISNLLKEKSGIVVAVSEGLVDEQQQPIVPPVFKTGRATYFGDVGAYLATLIIKELGYKARSEKPGLLTRCASATQSELDRKEAIRVGKTAVDALLEGVSGKMVALKRDDETSSQTQDILVPIEEVMLVEKVLPRHYINEGGNGVTPEFIQWLKPLVEPMSTVVSFYHQSQN